MGCSRVSELRRRLGLDSGHLSQVIRRLAAEVLLVTSPAPENGRARIVGLTDEGRRAWREIEERSDRWADEILSNFDPEERAELASTLETALRLLTAAQVRIEVIDPSARQSAEALEQYFA